MVKIHIRDAEHWITVHPQGNKEEKGTPLLIEGSNGHYVVKGGAGGKLNGKTVNPKSMSKARAGTEGEGEQPKGEQPKGEQQKATIKPHAYNGNWQVSHPKAGVMSFQSEQEARKYHEGINAAEDPVAFAEAHKKAEHEKSVAQIKTEQEKPRVSEVPEQPADPHQERIAKYKAASEQYGREAFEAGLPSNPSANSAFFGIFDLYGKGLSAAEKNQAFTGAYQEAWQAELKKKLDSGKGHVTVTNNPDSRFHAYRISVHLPSGNVFSLGMNETMEKNGVIPELKRFVEHEGKKISDGIGLADIQSAKNATEAREICDSWLQKQLEVYGDQSLPEAEREASKEGAQKAKQAKNDANATRHAKAYNEHVAARQAIKEKQAKVGNNRKPYTPQKTAKAAAQFAMDNNLADFADYGKCDAVTANAMNESVQRHLDMFPALRDKMKMVGSCQALNSEFFTKTKLSVSVELAAKGYSDGEIAEYLKTKFAAPKVNGKTYAFARNTQGIGYNEKWGKDASVSNRHLQNDVDSGWHPVGTGSQKGIIDHEMGHQLDYLLNLSNDPSILSRFNELNHPFNKSKMRNELSEYAAENVAEFIAEAWSEYLNNPEPRPTAKAVGDLIRKRYAEKHGA